MCTVCDNCKVENLFVITGLKFSLMNSGMALFSKAILNRQINSSVAMFVVMLSEKHEYFYYDIVKRSKNYGSE